MGPLGTRRCCDVDSTSQQRRVPRGMPLSDACWKITLDTHEYIGLRIQNNSKNRNHTFDTRRICLISLVHISMFQQLKLKLIQVRSGQLTFELIHVI